MRIQYETASGTRTIQFEFPPDRDEIVHTRPLEHQSTALDGTRQITHYANIYTLKQSFSMLSGQFIEEVLAPFFDNHALLGNTFNYYLGKSGGFYKATLEKRDFMPEKNNSTIDRYDIEFILRLESRRPIHEARAAVLYLPSNNIRGYLIQRGGAVEKADIITSKMDVN